MKTNYVKEKKKKNATEIIPEAATRCLLWKKVFLKVAHNSQENTCVGVTF